MGDPCRTFLSAGFSCAPNLAHRPESRFHTLEFRAQIPAAKRHREYDEVALLPGQTVARRTERLKWAAARLIKFKFQDANLFLARRVHGLCFFGAVDSDMLRFGRFD